MCGIVVVVLTVRYLHDSGPDNTALNVATSRGRYNHTTKNNVKVHRPPDKGQKAKLCINSHTLIQSIYKGTKKHMQMRHQKNRFNCPASSNIKM